MNCHLVAVEVGVECRTYERVNFDCAAFDEHGLERLNGEPVQRGRTVKKNGVFLDYVLENVPYEGLSLFYGALGALYIVALTTFNEPLHNEGLEKFDCHFLGQTALVKLEFGAYDDNRTTGVVDTLAEEILTETTLLAAEHSGKGLEFPVGRACKGLAAPAVIDERVHGFLKHALFVLYNHVGSAELHHSLKPVVAVYNPAV